MAGRIRLIPLAMRRFRMAGTPIQQVTVGSAAVTDVVHLHRVAPHHAAQLPVATIRVEVAGVRADPAALPILFRPVCEKNRFLIRCRIVETWIH